jgi:galactokinase/N-acetylgalactosamine kinase
LFGVLPVAIERDILIACAPRSGSSANQQTDAVSAPGSVVAENLHPKYTRQSFAPEKYMDDISNKRNALAEGWHLDINTKEQRWESYVKAGYYVRMLPYENFN